MDWDALWLSVRLAAATTLVLIAIGVPIAYWIVYSPRRWKVIVEAIVALPALVDVRSEHRSRDAGPHQPVRILEP